MDPEPSPPIIEHNNKAKLAHAENHFPMDVT